mgnify:CR=1 FL=1
MPLALVDARKETWMVGYYNIYIYIMQLDDVVSKGLVSNSNSHNFLPLDAEQHQIL